MAPKLGFDPRIVGNDAPGPRMPNAESQDGAEVRGMGKHAISGFLSRQFSQESREGILNHQVNI